MTRAIALLALVSLGCPSRPATPDASRGTFPWTQLNDAAAGCSKASDCVAVSAGGSCWPVTAATLSAPLAAQYRAWAAAGFNRASRSPPELSALEPSDVTLTCGAAWQGLTCREGRCFLAERDCEYGGWTRARCEASGGQWGGCEQGRGRLPGCNPPIKDRGKACTDSAQCEGVCVRGACTAYARYRGCGVLVGGKQRCQD